MNRESAIDLVRDLLVIAQKCRSNLLEGMGDDELAQRVLADLHPWLFGPKCIVGPLSAYLTRVEGGAPITGAELYNWVTIANREPALLVGALALARDLPEPDIHWLGSTW